MNRKHISWKTWAAAVLASACPSCGFRYIPYEHAKEMTEDQFLSLFHRDHNILHETGHEDRDKFWNLTPMLIKGHREKTIIDQKIIAKSRRIRRDEADHHMLFMSKEFRDLARENPERAIAEAFVAGCSDGRRQATAEWVKEADRPGGAVRWAKTPKIRSRGFDKRYKRKMDGTVVRRDD